jgi:hypothetical protein
MSEQEEQKFDIKSYIAYFKKFHFSWEYHYLLLVRFIFINPDWSGIYGDLSHTCLCSFGKEINFQNKRQKTESKNYNCFEFICLYA